MRAEKSKESYQLYLFHTLIQANFLCLLFLLIQRFFSGIVKKLAKELVSVVKFLNV